MVKLGCVGQATKAPACALQSFLGLASPPAGSPPADNLEPVDSDSHESDSSDSSSMAASRSCKDHIRGTGRQVAKRTVIPRLRSLLGDDGSAISLDADGMDNISDFWEHEEGVETSSGSESGELSEPSWEEGDTSWFTQEGSNQSSEPCDASSLQSGIQDMDHYGGDDRCGEPPLYDQGWCDSQTEQWVRDIGALNAERLYHAGLPMVSGVPQSFRNRWAAANATVQT